MPRHTKHPALKGHTLVKQIFFIKKTPLNWEMYKFLGPEKFKKWYQRQRKNDEALLREEREARNRADTAKDEKETQLSK